MNPIKPEYIALENKVRELDAECDKALKKLLNAPKDELAAYTLLYQQLQHQLFQATRAKHRFLAQELSEYAQNLNLDTLSHLYRERRYRRDSEVYVFYEPCPIVARKTRYKYLVVTSEDFNVPGFRPGGKFHISIAQLKEKGKAYHSRPACYFYVTPLSDRAPLPGATVLGGNQLPEIGSLVLGSPHR